MRYLRHIVMGLIAAAALSGCASNTLEGYIGRSVTEPMLDYGKPDEIFELSDGRRAYQWEVTSQGMRPSPRPAIGVGIGYGSGHWGNITTIGTSYVPYSKTCRYTLFAVPRGRDWIVTGFRKPAPGCA